MSTRRRVVPRRHAEYRAAWARLEAAATTTGARAWLFRSVDREDRFIEFLETSSGDSALQVDAIVEARAALDRAFGEGEMELWSMPEDGG